MKKNMSWVSCSLTHWQLPSRTEPETQSWHTMRVRKRKSHTGPTINHHIYIREHPGIWISSIRLNFGKVSLKLLLEGQPVFSPTLRRPSHFNGNIIWKQRTPLTACSKTPVAKSCNVLLISTSIARMPVTRGKHNYYLPRDPHEPALGIVMANTRLTIQVLMCTICFKQDKLKVGHTSAHGTQIHLAIFWSANLETRKLRTCKGESLKYPKRLKSYIKRSQPIWRELGHSLSLQECCHHGVASNLHISLDTRE